MKKEIVSTKNAPGAVGPYSQAVKCGGMVYTAGQVALDPNTGQMVEGVSKSRPTRCSPILRLCWRLPAQALKM